MSGLNTLLSQKTKLEYKRFKRNKDTLPSKLYLKVSLLNYERSNTMLISRRTISVECSDCFTQWKQQLLKVLSSAKIDSF
jgi:hypothetical protein